MLVSAGRIPTVRGGNGRRPPLPHGQKSRGSAQEVTPKHVGSILRSGAGCSEVRGCRRNPCMARAGGILPAPPKNIAPQPLLHLHPKKKKNVPEARATLTSGRQRLKREETPLTSFFIPLVAPLLSALAGRFGLPIWTRQVSERGGICRAGLGERGSAKYTATLKPSLPHVFAELRCALGLHPDFTPATIRSCPVTTINQFSLEQLLISPKALPWPRFPVFTEGKTACLHSHRPAKQDFLFVLLRKD